MNVSPSPDVAGQDFYRAAMEVLTKAGVEFLVGGAFAMRAYTSIQRDTKDFDLMLRPRDVARCLEALRGAGYRADYAFPHWLAKAHYGEFFIDLIYRAGNGLCEVDDGWFAAARVVELIGVPVKVCPAEEIIWQKAYIMERERFDGADVCHLLREQAEQLDWPRLLARFGPDWRVLLGHLVIFGFVYPAERSRLPQAVMRELLGRLDEEVEMPAATPRLCQGTLLSRAQYLPDIERWGYRDARLTGRAQVRPEELALWTNAIDRANRSA